MKNTVPTVRLCDLDRRNSSPIFGTVRSMTSESTARKLRFARYLARYAK